MKKYFKYRLLLTLPLIYSGCASSNSESLSLKNNVSKPYISSQSQANEIIKQNLEREYREFEKQSVQVSKDIQYTRIDPIQMREPNKYIIWARADVVEMDEDYLYIIPEGYRVIQETSGEIYINYDPIKEKEIIFIDENK